MFGAMFKAFGQLFSPGFRWILLKSVGLTIGLFILVGLGFKTLLESMDFTKWPWLDTTIDIVATLGLVAGMVFLIGPVSALFAGLFLDRIAEQVERKHYPDDPPGQDPPNTSIGGYGDTFGDWGQARNWTAGARVSIPLANIRARKNFHKAEFELRRAESSRTQLKQRIIVDIRSSARGLIASAEGVEAAERRRIAAAEQLRAERIRLEHGESTPFDVLQRQNDLVEAESQKVAALQAFRNSQAALDRAEGTILQVHNVQIDAVRALD